jgi:hypothetical protein
MNSGITTLPFFPCICFHESKYTDIEQRESGESLSKKRGTQVPKRKMKRKEKREEKWGEERAREYAVVECLDFEIRETLQFAATFVLLGAGFCFISIN